jgi:hypothetical protein
MPADEQKIRHGDRVEELETGNDEEMKAWPLRFLTLN